MKRVTVICATLFMVISFCAPALAYYVPADIVWIVDDSGSMEDDSQNIEANIGVFNQYLVDQGIDAQYALVSYLEDPVLQTDLTSSLTDFQDAFDGLSYYGGIQNAYEAVDASLNTGLYDLGISYRPGAVKTLILVTDEDADDWGTNPIGGTYGGNLGDLLDAESALLNIIYDPNAYEATSDFDPIARPSTALFNIYDFESDPAGFMLAFAEIKVEEIEEQIPDPAAVFLLGSACLLGFAGLRRKLRT